MSNFNELKQFKLTQEPIIKDKIIILHAVDNTRKKHKCVYFPGYRETEDTAAIKNLEVGIFYMLEGLFKPDRKTKEMQFVIERVCNSTEEQAVAVTSHSKPVQDLALIHTNSTTTTLKTSTTGSSDTSNAEEALLRELFQVPLGEALDTLHGMMRILTGAGN